MEVFKPKKQYEMRLIPIKDLRFAEYNPRSIKDKNFERLQESLSEFGVATPITVNMYKGRENIIVGGHMRVRALEQQAELEVPCFIVYLDEAKEKLCNIALNNPSMQGDWDEEKLAELIVKLTEEGVNVKLTGFDDAQITNLKDMQSLKGHKDDPEDFDAQAEYDAISTPESKPGEIYELGEHRLMCGDATNPEHVSKLMQNDKARLIFTDPPL